VGRGFPARCRHAVARHEGCTAVNAAAVHHFSQFFDLDVETLAVADLNEILLGMANQNTRRKCIIALKACVDHPAVKALRVPAAIPRDYDLPDENTLRGLSGPVSPRAVRKAWLDAGWRVGIRLNPHHLRT
jgi:hypothetical protein